MDTSQSEMKKPPPPLKPKPSVTAPKPKPAKKPPPPLPKKPPVGAPDGRSFPKSQSEPAISKLLAPAPKPKPTAPAPVKEITPAPVPETTPVPVPETAPAPTPTPNDRDPSVIDAQTRETDNGVAVAKVLDNGQANTDELDKRLKPDIPADSHENNNNSDSNKKDTSQTSVPIRAQRPKTRPKPRARTSLGAKGSKGIAKFLAEGSETQNLSSKSVENITSESGNSNVKCDERLSSKTDICDTAKNGLQTAKEDFKKRRSNSYEEAVNVESEDIPKVVPPVASPRISKLIKPEFDATSPEKVNRESSSVVSPIPVPRPKPRSTSSSCLSSSQAGIDERPRSSTTNDIVDERASIPVASPPPRSETVEVLFTDNELKPDLPNRRPSRPTRKAPPPPPKANIPTSKSADQIQTESPAEVVDLDSPVKLSPEAESDLLDSNEYLRPVEQRGKQKAVTAKESSGEYSYAVLPNEEETKTEKKKKKSSFRSSVGSHLFEVVFTNKRKTSSSSESNRKSKAKSQFYYDIDDQSMQSEFDKDKFSSKFEPITDDDLNQSIPAIGENDDLDVVIQPQDRSEDTFIPPGEIDQPIPVPQSPSPVDDELGNPPDFSMPKAPPRLKKKKQPTMDIEIDPLDNIVPVLNEDQPPALPDKKMNRTESQDEAENEYAYPEMDFPDVEEVDGKSLSSSCTPPEPPMRMRPRDQSEPLPMVPRGLPDLPPRSGKGLQKDMMQVPDEPISDKVSASSKAYDDDEDNIYIIPGQESDSEEEEPALGLAEGELDQVIDADSQSKSSNDYENEYTPIDECNVRESRQMTRAQSVEDILESEMDYTCRKSAVYVDPDSRSATLKPGNSDTLSSTDSHEYIVPDEEMMAVHKKYDNKTDTESDSNQKDSKDTGVEIQKLEFSPQSIRRREEIPQIDLVTKIAEELTSSGRPKMRRVANRRSQLKSPETARGSNGSSHKSTSSSDDSRPSSWGSCDKDMWKKYLTMNPGAHPVYNRQHSRSMDQIDTGKVINRDGEHHEDEVDGGSMLSDLGSQSFISSGNDESSRSFANSDMSSDDENDEEEVRQKEKQRLKVFYIAKEIYTSERAFVKVLRVLNQDFRTFISQVSEKRGNPIVAPSIMESIYKFLPSLQLFNEDLMRDLHKRVKNWNKDPRIADIFVKKGPFLKLYTSYILEYKNMCTLFENARVKYPEFDQAVKVYERGPKCAGLELKHYMLKPIQRIPQYRLLLTDYQKNITEDSPDYKDTEIALTTVSEVADHANQHMKYGDHISEMMEIQNSLIGQFEVIRPGRELLKVDVLDKLSRKEMQPRKFFLFTDVLLYTTPVGNGAFKVNNVLALSTMRVQPPTREDYENEFNIISTKRSFTVAAKSPEQKNEWMEALESAIKENAKKRVSFDPKRLHHQNSIMSIDLDHTDFKLGSKAPVWIPDKRVTMCMLCTAPFTVLYRRHHCRACGKVVCASCSDYRAPLRYCNNNPERVCEECYHVLFKEVNDLVRLSGTPSIASSIGSTQSISSTSSGGKGGGGSKVFSPANLKNRFERLKWTSFGKGDKGRPAVLKEVVANDESADMSGYLKLWQNKPKGWNKLWFVIKGKVMYTYKASEDTAATQSSPLLGYEVRPFNTYFQGIEPSMVFELIHRGMPTMIFRTESPMARDRWMKSMRDATIP